MTTQDSQSELDKIFNASPIDEEVPEDIWGTIYPTWTGLWTDGYGEWDEKQPSDIYPLTEILSREAEERLKKAIEAYVTTRVKEAEELLKAEVKFLEERRQMERNKYDILAKSTQEKIKEAERLARIDELNNTIVIGGKIYVRIDGVGHPSITKVQRVAQLATTTNGREE